jgi:CMP-N-acetylneuraminic acid synthetase
MDITGVRNVVSVNEDYETNGAIYLCDRGYWEGHRKFYGYDTFPYVMPNERSVDIDTLEDFELAERIMKASLPK